MSFRNTIIASQQERYLIFEIEVSEGANTLNWHVFGAGGTCWIDWGDGNTATCNSGYDINHQYDQQGTFFVKLLLDVDCTGLSTTASTVNIKRCNEAWGKQRLNSDFRVQFIQCDNSELVIKTLPSVAKYDNMFYQNINALLPIANLKDAQIVSGYNMFHSCQSALLPFNELPPTLTKNMNNMFYNCKKATFKITNVPDAVTTMNQSFDGCVSADIRLTKLPASIESLKLTFAYCGDAVKINLDELAANAPDGGYAALTTIQGAFADTPGVTGSQSRFLSVCPNLTNTTSAFIGTNTTE